MDILISMQKVIPEIIPISQLLFIISRTKLHFFKMNIFNLFDEIQPHLFQWFCNSLVILGKSNPIPVSKWPFPVIYWLFFSTYFLPMSPFEYIKEHIILYHFLNLLQMFTLFSLNIRNIFVLFMEFRKLI